MTETSVQETRAAFATHTHDYIRDQIKFADQKAAFLFAAASAILALVYGKGFQSHWVVAPTSATSLISFIGMSCLFTGAAFAASVVVPRRKGSPRGYIFWSAIAAYETSTEYVAAVSGLASSELLNETLHHCYELATICQRKYAALDRGIWFAAVGAAASAVALLIF